MRMTKWGHTYFIDITAITCNIFQQRRMLSFYGLSSNAISNFRLKRNGTNILCTYVCDLSTVINVSQKKYRVAHRSLWLSLSPYQPKITFVTRHAFTKRTCKKRSPSLSLFLF